MVNHFLTNGTRSLPRNPLDFTILDSCILAKALRRCENCLSVSNSLYGKLILSISWPVMFDDRFSIIPVSFFVADLTYLVVSLITLCWHYCVIFY